MSIVERVLRERRIEGKINLIEKGYGRRFDCKVRGKRRKLEGIEWRSFWRSCEVVIRR